MANVLITSRCNLRCEYCFAQARLQDRRNQVMAMEDVRKVIAFLKKSDHPNFRAMGGEPTMHPDFPEIVETTLQEGLHLDVLSNATWPETCNRLFNRISPDNLSFLLNIDHPTNYQSPVWKNIHRNLAAVAPLRSITLSFNIFETRPRYEYIFDLVKTYHIDKIRLSLSLPVIGARNAHLPFEDLKRMGPIVVEFARQAADLGAKVSLDNAAPLCMFSYEQAGELLLRGVLDLTRNARCEPIVDIGPDLTVWCCFCLSMLWNRRLSDFECLQEIVEYYKGIMGSYQDKLYPMDECDRCPYRKEWGCQAGLISVLDPAAMMWSAPMPKPYSGRSTPSQRTRLSGGAGQGFVRRNGVREKTAIPFWFSVGCVVSTISVIAAQRATPGRARNSATATTSGS
jgi:hypothetical protein